MTIARRGMWCGKQHSFRLLHSYGTHVQGASPSKKLYRAARRSDIAGLLAAMEAGGDIDFRVRCLEMDFLANNQLGFRRLPASTNTEKHAAINNLYILLQNGKLEHTPLITAAKRGHTEVVKLLLAAGAQDLRSYVRSPMIICEICVRLPFTWAR
jgi:ankyrin repeat protein